ncbi:MAG: hypothetical protein M3217_04465 [Actinomycetota bacterium]|nr:hypothetical protein [Actinomycetota bacterium]
MSAVVGSTSRGPADFGATVRDVLLSPATGFVTALRRVEVSAEGASTYVLGALGGASALLLWLKVSGLLGIREFAARDFEWSFFVVSLVLAALVSVAAQVAWSFLAPRAGGPDAGSPRSFRAVWALSGFPLLPALFVLLPLDVLFVGSRAFTTEAVGDSVSTAWVALSTAASVSLGIWAAYVFVRGTHAAARTAPPKTAAVVALGAAVAAAIVFLLRTGLVALKDAAA